MRCFLQNARTMRFGFLRLLFIGRAHHSAFLNWCWHPLNTARCLSSTLRLRDDTSAQVFPDIVGHFEEHLDHLGIELASRPTLYFLAC
jgi:hypothetical protein